MKKQKLNSLALNKTSISNLHSGSIVGGGPTQVRTVTCIPSSPALCKTFSERKQCGIRATEAYTCTQDSIAMSNCGLTQCESAGACA